MLDWQVARPFLKFMFPRLAVFPGSQVEWICVHLSGFVCFAGLWPWLEVLTTTCVRTNWRGDFSTKWNKGSKTKMVSKKNQNGKQICENAWQCLTQGCILAIKNRKFQWKVLAWKKFFFICNALPRGHFFVIISGISSESIYDRMVKGYHFIGLKWLAQPLSGHGAQ